MSPIEQLSQGRGSHGCGPGSQREQLLQGRGRRVSAIVGERHDMELFLVVTHRARRKSEVLFYTIYFLLLAFISASLLFMLQRYPCIFGTKILDARRATEYEVRIFTGGLTIDSKTGNYIRARDAHVEYFGPPTAEPELKWKDLLRIVLCESNIPVLDFDTDHILQSQISFLFLSKTKKAFLPKSTRADTRLYHFEPDVTHLSEVAADSELDRSACFFRPIDTSALSSD
jgi:hypothetical protein